MRNISDKLRTAMLDRTDFYAVASIRFMTGEMVTVGKEDFYIGNYFTQSCETTTFPYGVIIPKSINISLVNDDDRWRNYGFTGAKIDLWAYYNFDDGTTENIYLGEFTVITPENYGSTIEITAMDDCYKLDETYETDLSYPVQLREIYTEIIQKTGIRTSTSIFNNYNFVVEEAPKGSTYRKVLGDICAMAGGNGKFTTNNNFEIIPYKVGDPNGIEGGTFDTSKTYKNMLSKYLNTVSDMEMHTITSGYSTSFERPSFFHYNGSISGGIYVTRGSTICFRDSAPNANVTAGNEIRLGSTPVCTTVYTQDIQINGRNFFKIALVGSSLNYEVFLTDQSEVIVNIVNESLGNTVSFNEVNFTHNQTCDGFNIYQRCFANNSPHSRSWLKYTDRELYDNGLGRNFGLFNPINTWDDADGGIMSAGGSTIYYDEMTQSASIDTDDVVITGVSVSTEDGEVRAEGSTNLYSIQTNISFAKGKEQEVADILGSMLIGLSFRPFVTDTFPNPVYEAMDPIDIYDRYGDRHETVITDVSFSFSGFTTVKCSAESAIRSGSKMMSGIVENIKKSIGDIATNKTYPAIQIISKGMGLYTTTKPGNNGGQIWYLHDNQELETSLNMWKLDGNTFTVSNDGGKTWKNGFDTDGNAVLNTLAVTGFYFDWARGGTITLGGQNNVRGLLNILDSSGTKACELENGSLMFYDNARGIKLGVSKNGVELRNGNTVMATIGYNRIAHQLGASQGFNSGITISNHYVSGYKTAIAIGTYYPSSDTYATVFSASNDKTLSAGNYGNYGEKFRSLISGPACVMGRLKAETIHVGDLWVTGTLETNFGAKQRVLNTKNYGQAGLFSYETPTPMFGDVGGGCTDETGLCVVEIDDRFNESTLDTNYFVFLQKEGDGDLWVSEKTPTYFCVRGTANLHFAWEIKSQQIGSGSIRFDAIDHSTQDPDSQCEEIYATEFKELFDELEDYL